MNLSLQIQVHLQKKNPKKKRSPRNFRETTTLGVDAFNVTRLLAHINLSCLAVITGLNAIIFCQERLSESFTVRAT